MTIIFKKLTNFHLKPEIINFFFFLFTTLAFLALILLKKTPLEIPTKSIPLFVIIAIIAIAYNYFSISAIASAPNPGYVEAITSLRVVVILAASILFFGSEITPMKLIGIAFCILGIFIISY